MSNSKQFPTSLPYPWRHPAQTQILIISSFQVPLTKISSPLMNKLNKSLWLQGVKSYPEGSVVLKQPDLGRYLGVGGRYSEAGIRKFWVILPLPSTLSVALSKPFKGEREKHQRERETSIGCLSFRPLPGQAHNPGMCPDWNPTRGLLLCRGCPTS